MERCQSLIATVSSLIELLSDPATDLIHVNMGHRLGAVRDSVSSLIRALSRHQRVAATHIFVLMISCDQRNRKPYAMPVQCVPYKSLSHSQTRNLISKLAKEMVSRGMTVAGNLTFFQQQTGLKVVHHTHRLNYP